MDYYTMTTNAGDESIAHAIQTGTKTTFQKIAVGDGNGTYYDPAKSQTALRREVWRGEAVVSLDANNAKRVIVTATIPATVGGFTVREAGIFDTAGTLMVISKLPLSEKVAPESGASSDLVIRLYVEVSDANAVSVTVDPSAVMATKGDVAEASAQAAADLTAHTSKSASHVTQLTCTKTGTVYALTGLTATSGVVSCMFKVDTAFTAGNTVTINGTAYTLKTIDGTALTAGAWAQGALVHGIVDVDNKVLYVTPSAPVGAVARGIAWWDGTNNYGMGDTINLSPPSQAAATGALNIVCQYDANGYAYVKFVLNTGNHKGAFIRLHDADDWSNTEVLTTKNTGSNVALATPGLRNAIIIQKTDSIPTGLADGTIVMRYTP